MSQGRDTGRSSRARRELGSKTSSREAKEDQSQRRNKEKKSSSGQQFSRSHNDYPELTPTILLKSRTNEARSLSPSVAPASPLKIGRDAQHETVKDANPETSKEKNILLKMTEGVKLINEEFEFRESALSEYLSDAADFLVVGCVGPQWSGKSSLVSYLANSSCSSFVKRTVFPVSNSDVQQKMETASFGLNAFISDDRVIWLDCQPLLSAAIAELRLSSSGAKESFSGPEQIETSIEVQSLQLLSFLYCVCHVVLVVQDSLIDPNLLRLLQTAEMLKPNTGSPDSPSNDSFPHLVFVHNQSEPDDLCPRMLTETCTFYSRAFSKSRLRINSSLNENIDYLPVDLQRSEVNFIPLPNWNLKTDDMLYPEFGYLIPHLKKALLSMKRFPLGPAGMNEKSWLVYASKAWDAVRKSVLIMDYARLLQ